MWGNSLAVRIPREISKKLNFKSGSSVVLSVKDKAVLVRPVKKSRTSIKDLVSQITNENKQTLVFDDNPQGKEIW